MNYERAFNIIASYVDASVNPSYDEVTRLDYQHLAYWFKQVIQYKDNKSMSDRYVSRIVSNDKCLSFGMFPFLVDNGLFEVKRTSAFNA